MKAIRKIGIALAVIALPSSVRTADAHHSWAQYDSTKTLQLTGTITRADWMNPHIYIQMDVKTRDGAVERWTVECPAPNQMTRRGLQKENIKVGDSLTVSGMPPKPNGDFAYLSADLRSAGKDQSPRVLGLKEFITVQGKKVEPMTPVVPLVQ